MENAVDVYSQHESLTAKQIKAQVQLIQEVMKAVMEKDVHYGVIPGTPKPTLYKPGSEKILSTFLIGVEPETEDLSTFDEVRYRVKAKGFSQKTGALLGVGVGECSSNEEKYKWRKPVCDEEFNETPEDRKRIVWKKGYENKPNYQLKQIRTNPSDVANTILKMAKKRAQIDMTLTVTAASDIFDQDLEDMEPETREALAGKTKEDKPPLTQPGKKSDKETSKEETKTVTIGIKDVTSKSGTKKDGTAYTISTILGADGQKYGTFDKKFADLASCAQDTGAEVVITYTEGKFGRNISNLTNVEPSEERQPGEGDN